jgi:hypothetical protein
MIPLAAAMRASFGFSNPNAAGALFAMLSLGVWVLPGRSRAVMVLKSMATMAGIILMAMTASRGALVGLLLGASAWWLSAGRPFPRRGWMILAAALPLMMALIIIPGAMGKRLACSSLQEPSLASRLEVYRAIPKLLVSAPGGWGSGQAAEAYENWFQQENDTRHFKNLLSTHGTWLAEWSWPLRFLYVTAWWWVLLVAWRVPRAFGIWIVWGTACCFSHVGKEWVLWLIPLAALLSAFWCSRNEAQIGLFRGWLLAGGGALICCLLLGALGLSGNAIRKSTHEIVVGRGGVLFYHPDERVVGTTWGKMVRGWRNVTVATDWEGMKPQESTRVVFTGNAPVPAGVSLSGDSLLWVNPPAELDQIQTKMVLSFTKRTLLWGELRSDADPMDLRKWAGQSGVSWVDLPGTGLYVPGEKLGEAMTPSL